jgi:hypothetical protein
MNPENNKSSFYSSFKTYGQHFWPLFSLSLSFVTVAIIIMVIEAFLPFSLFVSIPLILTPFYFSLLVMNVRVKREKFVPLNSFYLYLLPGISAAIRVVIKPFKTILKAFLIFLLATFFLSLISNWLLPIFSPVFAEIVNQINIMLTAGTTSFEQINEFIISRYEDLAPFYNSIFLLSSLFAVIYFVYTISANSMVLHGLIGWGPLSVDLSSLTKRIFQKAKSQYFIFFIKNQWLSIVLFITGYTLGAVFSFLFIKEFSYLFVISLISGLILQGWMLPHYLDIQSLQFESLRPLFNESFRLEISSFLALIELDKNIPEEEKESLRQFCSHALKNLDKTNEKKDDIIRP